MQIFAHADDTTVAGMIRNMMNQPTGPRCRVNNLLLNITRTKEMIIDFLRGEVDLSALVINDSFKFLGTTISHTLKWEVITSHIINKAHQRLHFLSQLKKSVAWRGRGVDAALLQNRCGKSGRLFGRSAAWTHSCPREWTVRESRTHSG